jgi:hypothetical protein
MNNYILFALLAMMSIICATATDYRAAEYAAERVLSDLDPNIYDIDISISMNSVIIEFTTLSRGLDILTDVSDAIGVYIIILKDNPNVGDLKILATQSNGKSAGIYTCQNSWAKGIDTDDEFQKLFLKVVQTIQQG